MANHRFDPDSPELAILESLGKAIHQIYDHLTAIRTHLEKDVLPLLISLQERNISVFKELEAVEREVKQDLDEGKNLLIKISSLNVSTNQEELRLQLKTLTDIEQELSKKYQILLPLKQKWHVELRLAAVNFSSTHDKLNEIYKDIETMTTRFEEDSALLAFQRKQLCLDALKDLMEEYRGVEDIVNKLSNKATFFLAMPSYLDNIQIEYQKSIQLLSVAFKKISAKITYDLETIKKGP